MNFDLSPGEIIDRASVLQVKIEMIKTPSLSTQRQLKQCFKTLELFDKARVDWYFDQLYLINQAQWVCNQQIINDQEKPEPTTMEDAMMIVRNQRYCHGLNRKRNELKNAATREFGSDLVEEKSFARAQQA